jgi:hypothetical protein
MGGKSSSSYSETVIRKPDDVKIADINSKKDIKIAELEIEFKKEAAKAQKELIETNGRIIMLMEEARVANLQKTGQALLEFTKQLNILATERIAVLQSNSHHEIIQINMHYKQVICDIYQDQVYFAKEELPTLINTLNSFEKNSDGYKLYLNTIDLISSEFVKSVSERVKSAREQELLLINSNAKLKELIIGSTQNIIEHTMASNAALLNEKPFIKELADQMRNQTFIGYQEDAKKLTKPKTEIETLEESND